LKSAPDNAKAFRMSKSPTKKMSREDRLAAKLRENLRRRKAQERAQAHTPDDSDGPTEMLSNAPSPS
jgi:hypothetical protein